MKKTLRFLYLMFILSIVLAACAPTTASKRRDLSPLVFRASSEFNLATNMIAACQPKDGVDKGLKIQLSTMGDIDIKKKIDAEAAQSGDAIQAHVYAAASPYWINNQAITGKTFLAMSPVVLTVSPELENQTGWNPNEGVGITDLITVANANPPILNLGLPSSSQDDAGINFMSAALTALKGDGLPLQPEDVERLSPLMKPLTDRVTAPGSSATRVEEVILGGMVSVNAAVLPENLALDMNAKLEKQGQPPWHLYYVNGATSLQMYTIGYLDELKGDKRDQAKNFISCMAKQDWIGIGFRKSNVSFNMPDLQNTGLFKAAWDANLVSEPILTVLPQDPAVFKLQNVYQLKLRKGSQVVILDDFSPSMEVDQGKENLMAAMRNILLQDVAETNILQAGPDDQVWVYLFDSGILDKYGPIIGEDTGGYQSVYDALDKHPLGNATDIYGAAQEGLKTLSENYDPAKIQYIILVTDGEQTDFDHTLATLTNEYNSIGRNIPIYTIMIGKAVYEDLKAISDLTGSGDVCNGKGGEEALVNCFKRFKGN